MQLYEKSVHVHIKTSNVEEKKVVTISISQLLNESRKFLSIQLTDEKDPLFLYQIAISENEFCELKTQQTLLVDFTQFPYKFIELLDLCISSSLSDHPKFICRLINETHLDYGLFSIVETNTFKHINHLSLKVKPGNDASTKMYLAQVVKDLKADKTLMEMNIHNCQILNLESQENITQVTKEFEILKQSSTEDANNLKLKFAHDISIEKDRFLAEREAFRSSNELQIRELVQKHEQEFQILTVKLASSSSNYNNVLQISQSFQSNLATTKKELDNEIMSKNNISKDLVHALELKENHKITINDLEREIKCMTKQIQVLKISESDANVRDQKSADKLEFIQAQMGKEERSVSVFKTQNAQLEDGIRKAGEEISKVNDIKKANDIIRKLQSDFKNAKLKLKSKSAVVIQQEKLLEEKAFNQDQIQSKATEIEQHCSKHLIKLEEQRLNIAKLESVAAESKSIILDNNRVIEWLHKQLNDQSCNKVGNHNTDSRSQNHNESENVNNFPKAFTQSGRDYSKFQPASFPNVISFNQLSPYSSRPSDKENIGTAFSTVQPQVKKLPANVNVDESVYLESKYNYAKPIISGPSSLIPTRLDRV